MRLSLGTPLCYWHFWLLGQECSENVGNMRSPTDKQMFLSSILMPMAVQTLGSVEEYFQPQAEQMHKEIPLIYSVQLCKGNQGSGLWYGYGENRRTTVFLAFMAGGCRAGHLERPPGMSCCWFYLTLTLWKEMGLGGVTGVRSSLGNWRRTSMKLTMG